MINHIRDRVQLNNGSQMPWLGLGVFRMTDEKETELAIRAALEIGYRSIDTATIYKNETSVGRAIRASGVPRQSIFLTTKVWNSDLRQQRVLAAFEESLARLAVDYIDLYLIHWPVSGYYQPAWKELEKIYASGRAKAIGVSNFTVHHLEDLLSECQIVPVVNQVEFHPRLFQPKLLDFCQRHHIQVEAWAPLMRGQIFTEDTVQKLAAKYRRTPAQVILRWDLQHQVVTIPKSTHPSRIAENAQIFDFELSEEEMCALDGLDQGKRIGPHPDQVNF
jgi:methylglyoxal/glyoxal reductase